MIDKVLKKMYRLTKEKASFQFVYSYERLGAQNVLRLPEKSLVNSFVKSFKT